VAENRTDQAVRQAVGAPLIGLTVIFSSVHPTCPSMELVGLWLALICLLHVSAASHSKYHHNQRHRTDQRVSQELFGSLDELARIVDVSYCVGATGVYKPFRCLSRCGEFEDFELVTVRRR
jgi:hypothetical protein